MTFDLALTDATGSAALFIGQDEAPTAPISLDRDDPRLAGEVADTWSSKPGVYIRAVSGPRDAEPTRLPKAVIEHLEALGYVDPEPD